MQRIPFLQQELALGKNFSKCYNYGGTAFFAQATPGGWGEGTQFCSMRAIFFHPPPLDLGQPISLEALFYEVDMEWDMIMDNDFMVDTSTGFFPAQSSMTLYREDRLLWFSTTHHQVSCAWIWPEWDQIEKAIKTIQAIDRPPNKYGFGNGAASCRRVGSSIPNGGCVCLRPFYPPSGM